MGPFVAFLVLLYIHPPYIVWILWIIGVIYRVVTKEGQNDAGSRLHP